ncbi:MAG: hypothetical protein WAW63_03160 [Candidatus Saccharimonadales bacterium]
MLFLFVFVFNTSRVAALSADQALVYERGVFAYDVAVGAECGSAELISTGAATGATSGSWSSGLQPPYILEQFAIEILKNIAKKKGVDPSVTVTEEHVIALVAFMWGEGGDINNGNLFNPLNTGINSPELLATANDSAGRQSFSSFDNGVEGTTRTMVGTNQSRLAATLAIQNSTAEQFMEALTYFKRYEGNKFWAALSDPNYDGSDGIPALGPNAPQIYYQQRLTLVNQTRSRYADMAGTVLGTTVKEQPAHITAKEKLVYSPVGDKSSPTNATSANVGDGSCLSTNSVSSGTNLAVAQRALEFSWPTKQADPMVPKPEYVAALKEFNPGKLESSVFNGGADCGVFVGTVMHASGADPNYPGSSTTAQLEYVKNHPEKYEFLPPVTDTSQLRVGDILIVTGSPGHTWIYVGPQSGSGFSRADASMGTRMPVLGNALLSDNRGGYMIARLISTNPGGQ